MSIFARNKQIIDVLCFLLEKIVLICQEAVTLDPRLKVARPVTRVGVRAGILGSGVSDIIYTLFVGDPRRRFLGTCFLGGIGSGNVFRRAWNLPDLMVAE